MTSKKGKLVQSLCVFILLLQCIICAEAGAKCLENERQALLSLKQEVIDDHGYLSSWSVDEEKRDCCQWRGVSCSNRTRHVIALDLRFADGNGSALKGNISSSLIELSHLAYLDLSVNDFGGQKIPDFIGSLNNLRYLNLSFTNLGGRIPYQLGNLSRLRTLDLSDNFMLYADKLEWLSSLSKLEHLILNFASLNEATDWLQVVSQMGSLRELQLQQCYLPGIVPPSISFVNASKSLTTLSLRTNSLPNSVYSWLSNFSSSNLVSLDLGDSNLQGPIPGHVFQDMTSLVQLDLCDNEISKIPNLFRNMCSLNSLDLSGNNLTGQISDLFYNMPLCTKKSLEILDLSDNKLAGSLPDMAQFSSIRELDLSGNNLTGQISDLFYNMPLCTKKSLEILDLSDNKLAGSLPDMAQFSSLRELDLSFNELDGRLTESIRHLSSLETLAISSNHLEGMISEVVFTNLSQLKKMSFSSNLLSFNFSPNWVPPFNLDVLEMGNCALRPEFPSWLKGQNSCSVIDLSGAGIADAIPIWFWDQTRELCWLNLSHNNLKGVLPDLTANFASSPGIDLSFNSFEGPIPLFPPNVVSLNLSKNKFSRTLSFLCAIVGGKFSYLDLSDNQVSGKIPDCWTRWTDLYVLSLDNNNISGKLPESTSFCMLQTLHLRNNSFSGMLPSSLKNCSRLKFIDIGSNRFSGTIPTWIGSSLPNLVVLNLQFNRFHVSIPLELCQLAYSQVLDLSLNNISGIIPKCINNLTAMAQNESLDATISYPYPYYFVNDVGPGTNFVDQTILGWKGAYSEYQRILGLVRSIDFSSNRLHGEIPEDIASLVKLVSLNLSRNNLIGTIKPGIGELNRLNSLDLSNNRLSGEIPSSFSKLNFLGVLDLSNNNLSGKIPTGTQLQSFGAFAYKENPGLCGHPLQIKCPGEESATGESVAPEIEDEDKLITSGFYASIGIGHVVGFWGVFGTFLVRNRQILCKLIKLLKLMNNRP